MPRYLYIGLDVAPGVVKEINLDTFAEVNTVATADLVWSLAKSGDYLYAGQWTTPAIIAKIALATFTVDATLTLDVDEDDCRALLVYSGFLYAGLWPAPWPDLITKVTKINLSTFTKVSTLDYNYANGAGCRALVRDGGFLYGSLFGSPIWGGTGYVCKIDLSGFTKVSELTLTNQGATALCLQNNYLYVGHFLSPGMVTRVNLTTFTEDGILTLNLGEDEVLSMAIDGNFLYVGLRTIPAQIAKINLTTFTQVATLTLAVGENICEALAVDSGYLYAGTLGVGVLSKIDLATFTEVDTLPFPDGIAVGSILAEVLALPTVSTDPATSIGANSSTPNGTLDDDGGEACDCGFEWGETIAYGNTTPTQSKTTGQTFSQVISGLTPNTTYHFRAFATNSVGTRYGADRSFTTLVAIPTVSTDAATSVLQQFATPNGTLDNDGGEACDCGFEWGETIAYGNTTPTQSRTTGQTFSQVISGLTPNTTYHFRAFGTNSAGAGYGADMTFTTQQLLVELLAVSKSYALAREEL